MVANPVARSSVVIRIRLAVTRLPAGRGGRATVRVTSITKNLRLTAEKNSAARVGFVQQIGHLWIPSRCSSVADFSRICVLVESERMGDARFPGCLAIRHAALAILLPIYFQNALSALNSSIWLRKSVAASNCFPPAPLMNKRITGWPALRKFRLRKSQMAGRKSATLTATFA
jgi:hypothetical protein